MSEIDPTTSIDKHEPLLGLSKEDFMTSFTDAEEWDEKYFFAIYGQSLGLDPQELNIVLEEVKKREDPVATKSYVFNTILLAAFAATLRQKNGRPEFDADSTLGRCTDALAEYCLTERRLPGKQILNSINQHIDTMDGARGLPYFDLIRQHIQLSLDRVRMTHLKDVYISNLKISGLRSNSLKTTLHNALLNDQLDQDREHLTPNQVDCLAESFARYCSSKREAQSINESEIDLSSNLDDEIRACLEESFGHIESIYGDPNLTNDLRNKFDHYLRQFGFSVDLALPATEELNQ